MRDHVGRHDGTVQGVRYFQAKGISVGYYTNKFKNSKLIHLYLIQQIEEFSYDHHQLPFGVSTALL